MVATTVDEVRRAWAFIDKTWRSTLERAAQLPEATLHERVDDEWSFVETQRHLLFATDVWLRRGALADPDGWHRLGMPPDLRTGQPDPDGAVERWGIDVFATPSYAEVLAVRGEYLHLVGGLVHRLTPGQLRRPTSCNPPWIAATVQVSMSTCFGVVYPGGVGASSVRSARSVRARAVALITRCASTRSECRLVRSSAARDGTFGR